MLKVNQLLFSYPHQHPAVDQISFEVQTGEHIALIGESGCGKSSLLHLIFGKLQPNSGSVVWNGKAVQGPMQKLIPGEEDVKLLTQEFDLMPFISVEQNITKYLSRMYPERNHQRCNELLEVVDLVGYGNRMVKALSGGQKQRVAIAQCLANQPKLLLMDEPFSHIDQFKKNKLRRRLFQFLKKENITCIFATHDPKDMLHFSDKTLVMSNAKLIDFRTPNKLYENPKNKLVASLFEEANVVPNNLISAEIPVGNYLFYPHEIEILASNNITPVKAIVEQSFFQGNTYLHELKIKLEHVFIVESSNEISAGSEVYLQFTEVDFILRKLE